MMRRIRSCSDADLLAATPHDSDAFADLYRRHERAILGHFMHWCRSPELAADLMAETFGAAFEFVGRYRPELGEPRAWLFGIARHVLLRSVRRGRVEDATRRRLGMAVLVLDDNALDRVETLGSSRRDVSDALEGLSAVLREAVAGRVIERTGVSGTRGVPAVLRECGTPARQTRAGADAQPAGGRTVTVFPEFEHELRTLAQRSAATEPNRRARRTPDRARWRRASRAIPIVASLVVVVAVAAVVLSVRGRDETSTPSHAAAPRARDQHPSGLAVLERAQTAKDRTMPAVVRRAVRLGALNSRTVMSFLRDAIAISMRYAQTLPDGREVFLTRVHDPQVHQPLLGLWIIAPDGSWQQGQPVLNATVGLPDNRIARIQAAYGPSCSVNIDRSGVPTGVTDWSIVPDGVVRVRWRFSREDLQGHTYQPLTLDVPVRGNTAVATIPGRATCDNASVTTLYASGGRVIAH